MVVLQNSCNRREYADISIAGYVWLSYKFMQQKYIVATNVSFSGRGHFGSLLINE